jgi:hypothetical protein
MPIYMEVSRLHRTVTIVARGAIDPEEIRAMAVRLTEAKVRSFAKILEVAGATTNFTVEQVERLATLLRGASTEKRGPIAFVVDPKRMAFPQAFASRTEDEGPIRLFTSLRDARRWTEQILASSAYGRGPDPQSVAPQGQTAFTDPAREGVMLRGNRQREVTVRSLEAA